MDLNNRAWAGLYWSDGSTFLCTEEETGELLALSEEAATTGDPEDEAKVIMAFQRMNAERHRVIDMLFGRI